MARKAASFAQLRKRYQGHGKKLSLRALEKEGERIMDHAQHLLSKAGHSNAPPNARLESEAYATSMIPRMRRLAQAARRSDDPGGAIYLESWLKRLQRIKDRS